MKSIKHYISIMLVSLVFAGCTMLAEKPGQPEEVDYYSILERWTRTERVYSGVEVTLHIDVVYMGREMRTAYLQEYAGRLGLTEEKKESLKRAELSKLEEYNEFILVAATPVEEWNDLDSKDSIWRLYLVDEDGDRVEPVEIERLDRDAILREFFPFIDEWSTPYRVIFPRLTPEGHTIGTDSEYIRLKVSGIKGSTELLWTLKE